MIHQSISVESLFLILEEKYRSKDRVKLLDTTRRHHTNQPMKLTTPPYYKMHYQKHILHHMMKKNTMCIYKLSGGEMTKMLTANYL